jgi:hypothetical protein
MYRVIKVETITAHDRGVWLWEWRSLVEASGPPPVCAVPDCGAPAPELDVRPVPVLASVARFPDVTPRPVCRRCVGPAPQPVARLEALAAAVWRVELAAVERQGRAEDEARRRELEARAARARAAAEVREVAREVARGREARVMREAWLPDPLPSYAWEDSFRLAGVALPPDPLCRTCGAPCGDFECFECLAAVSGAFSAGGPFLRKRKA